METSLEPVGDAGQFLYDTAVKRIESQEQDLNEIRQRAATVGTFGVAATGLLGAFVLNKHPHALLGLVALGVFVAAVVMLGFVLLPRSGWNFRVSPTILESSYLTTDGKVELRELAHEMDRGANTNQTKLDLLMNGFSVAVVLLGVETALWLVALAVR